MSKEWADTTAPTLADFEALAAEAWEKLPTEFRAMAGDLLIRVEDFATDEILESLGIEDPFELTGLYQGVSLTKQSVTESAREPDMVFLYRRAILDEWNGKWGRTRPFGCACAHPRNWPSFRLFRRGYGGYRSRSPNVMPIHHTRH